NRAAGQGIGQPGRESGSRAGNRAAEQGSRATGQARCEGAAQQLCPLLERPAVVALPAFPVSALSYWLFTQRLYHHPGHGRLFFRPPVFRVLVHFVRMKEQGANSLSNAAAWREQDGVAVLAMPALEAPGGVRAFFTGRRGGVSPQWQGGLNWSYSVGDEPANVVENRRRSIALLGLPMERTVMAGLVHGNRVVAVTGEEAPGPDAVRFVPDCDALITDRPGLALVVTAADCVPVFLYDPVRRAIGAVHAGWRGTVAGVAARAVAAMAEAFGSRPADLLAAVGPSIGPCCYEVDDAVAEPLRTYYGDFAGELLAPGRAPGKYLLNLWEANRRDLRQAGVAQVSVSAACTACGVDRLFSHRAEAGAAGRGAAVIALV
ncbi:MAG: hypothetical protein JWN15_1157, partial [Firmicutes bacterium]|nr:hypothetical protein [Bacillota bacterium]